MTKVILITGATDGIGLATAKSLAAEGQTLLLHGRNAEKLEAARAQVLSINSNCKVEAYVADFANLKDVAALAEQIRQRHDHLDVLINNAGVYKTTDQTTGDGLDVRFAVNALAPYVLTRKLMPLMGTAGRIINLSSAAQASVNFAALAGGIELDDMEAYAQSKLALTMWSAALAEKRKDGPIIVAVNPGSLLATKMVREGFGVAGSDVGSGADILMRAALSDEFAGANGKYFDGDIDRFAPPHADALDRTKCSDLHQAAQLIADKHLGVAAS